MGTREAAKQRHDAETAGIPRGATHQLPITEFAHKATIVGDAAVAAVLAALDMAAEGRGAAGLDRRHDFKLAEADVPGMGRAPGGPVSAEDAGDLECRALAAHGAQPLGAAPSPIWAIILSSGLVTVCTTLVATRV